MKNLSFAIALLTGGCVVYQQPATYSIPQRAVVEPAHRGELLIEIVEQVPITPHKVKAGGK